MPHSITTIEHRTATLRRVKPTIADLKAFIADTEAAGIKETTRVEIERIAEIIGSTWGFAARQKDEIPMNASTEDEA